MINPTCRQKGFTLLEVMLASGVFALLSFLAFMVLSQSLRIHERTLVETQRFNQLMRAVQLFDNDLQQLVARTNRSTNTMLISGKEAIFTTQTLDPRNPLSDAPVLQTVRWFVKNNILYRAQRSSVDADSELPPQPVLDQIDTFLLEPERVDTKDLPAQVTLVLQHRTYGLLQRQFDLLPPLSLPETAETITTRGNR
jgi:general secretion pathway protein J